MKKLVFSLALFCLLLAAPAFADDSTTQPIIPTSAPPRPSLTIFPASLRLPVDAALTTATCQASAKMAVLSAAMDLSVRRANAAQIQNSLGTKANTQIHAPSLALTRAETPATLYLAAPQYSA